MLPSSWPRWIIIPIGFALAVASIGIGLVLEPAVQSLAQHPEPTPTLPCLDYAAPLSSDCVDCHTDAQRIQSLALSATEADRAFIEPTQVNSVHGRLGCVTCHGGASGTEDASAAHQGLVPDPSTRFEETCVLCHRNLYEATSGELLHEPHEAVMESPRVVRCSECHGAVGHGFSAGSGEVICSMGACLDCHEEQDLDIQSQDCDGCHVGPHDVAAALSCSDCHTSIDVWSQTQLSVHPVRLTGRHAEADCFACHRWPNFRSLDYVCTDCHERAHSYGSDDCRSCHTTEGWGESTMAGHTFSIDHGGADGDCAVCHPGTETSKTYCFTCHSSERTVDVHETGGMTDVLGKCMDCHPEG